MRDAMEDHYRFMHGLEPVRHEGPFKLFARDRFMGTVPGFPVESTSGIFDVRPTDFAMVERDGEKIVEVRGMLGPGDFACIKGFDPTPDLPGCYSERDEMATAHGASRLQAIETVISDALSNRKGKTA